MYEVTFFDTESSGLTRRDKVFNIAFCCVSVDEEAKTQTLIGYTDLFNDIPVKMNIKALECHGVTNAMLKDIAKGTQIKDNIQLVSDIIGASQYLGGHNTQFDIRMTQGTYGDCNNILNKKYIDTRSMCSKYFGHQMTLGKAVVASQINPEEDFVKDFPEERKKGKYHTALFDAYCTARIFAKMKGFEWIVNFT